MRIGDTKASLAAHSRFLRYCGKLSRMPDRLRDVKDLSHPKPYGFLITNPPYGERISEKEELPALYKTIGQVYAGLDKWSMYIITSYEEAEKYIGRKADKNRKIYNGMIRSYFYQFMGPKPPKRTGAASATSSTSSNERNEGKAGNSD